VCSSEEATKGSPERPAATAAAWSARAIGRDGHDLSAEGRRCGSGGKETWRRKWTSELEPDIVGWFGGLNLQRLTIFFCLLKLQRFGLYITLSVINFIKPTVKKHLWNP
jgi:hypothetical protein